MGKAQRHRDSIGGVGVRHETLIAMLMVVTMPMPMLVLLLVRWMMMRIRLPVRLIRR